MGRRKQGAQHKDRRTEKGAIVKRAKGLVRLALVYPNRYQAGMSSLGFQSLYRRINELEGVACERVFLPDKPRERTCPASCETGLPLSRFDIVAFSVSFENDYLNIILLLERAGIPLHASARGEKDPLVIAGGVACFMNPEPVAVYMDCIFLGEAEFLIKEFFDLYESWTREGTSRQDFKQRSANELNGIYVPSLYRPEYTDDGVFSGLMGKIDGIPETIPVVRVENLSRIKTTTAVMTSHTAFKDSYLIETGRGCPHGCRFCSAGYVYRPPRFYPSDVILDAMAEAELLTNRVGLVSAAVSDHPEIDLICSKGLEKNLKISFSSLRVDGLTDAMIKNLVNAGTKTATIAPEAGSEKMRRVINKKIREADILSGVQRLVSHGIINVKLYFMIGLPFETDDDVEAIAAMTEKIRDAFVDASRKQKKIGTMTLSINPFVPKPGTPFQWTSMLPVPVLKKRLNIIKNRLKNCANLKINAESNRVSRINALLARGDRRMSKVMETAARSGWSTALKQHREYCQDQLYSPRSTTAPLPWDFIDTGVNKEFLKDELTRAEAVKTSGDCPMISCEQCRICR
ncbi:MAG: radical SAM protein [Desulfobacteraceae bacterium]